MHSALTKDTHWTSHSYDDLEATECTPGISPPAEPNMPGTPNKLGHSCSSYVHCSVSHATL
jgi:hypothetical protein